jgi:hypothetical protein
MLRWTLVISLAPLLSIWLKTLWLVLNVGFGIPRATAPKEFKVSHFTNGPLLKRCPATPNMATDKTLDDNPKAIPTEAEAPPRYEGHSMDDKGAKGEPHHTEASSSSRLQVEPRPGAGKSKSFIGRLWGTVSRSRQEARTTVMTNIRRLMHNPRATSLDWTTLLDNCERICSDSSVSLSFLLQEYFIEDHTPLYWAIVKRDEGENDSINDPDLLTILMKAAAPLTEPTVSDIYSACIVTSDQPLFQSLRYMPSFSSPMSGIDQLLLSNTATRDQVTVEDIPGVNGSFVAMFEIAKFQKRMRVSEEIILEFIARGAFNPKLTNVFFISNNCS